MKKADSCDVFLEKAIRSLRPGGTLSFVLPESVLTVKSHRRVRRLLLEMTRIRRVVYVGTAFRSVNCPCILLTLERREEGMTTQGMEVVTPARRFTIGTDRELTEDIFAFDQTDEEYALLRKMEAGGERFTLKGQADFALGIVTGDNAGMLRERGENEKILSAGEQRPSEAVVYAGRAAIEDPENAARTANAEQENADQWEPILRGCEIHPYRAEEPRFELIYRPDHFQQCAPEAMYRSTEKILYRFIGSRPVAMLDREGRLSLNSCNILIPRVPGLPAEYVLALLNSRAAGFWWKRRYPTVKILRGQLENFPMPIPDREELDRMMELVRELERAGESRSAYRSESKAPSAEDFGGRRSVESLHAANESQRDCRLEGECSGWTETLSPERELDALIEKLYGLTEEESRLLQL